MSTNNQAQPQNQINKPESVDEVLKRIRKNKEKNAIVATSGLDSWNAVKDDSIFQTLPQKQKIEYAKQFDPVVTGLQEQYTKKREKIDSKGNITHRRITSDEFYDENIENYSSWNKSQQQRFNVLHNNLVSQEISDENRKIQDDRRLGNAAKQEAKALVHMNKAFTQVSQFAPILEEIAGDTTLSNQIIEKLNNLVVNPRLYDTEQSYRKEYSDVSSEVMKFVNSVDVKKISAGAGFEHEYVNPITGDITTMVISGSDPKKIRRKLYMMIMREYEQMANEVGKAREDIFSKDADPANLFGND